LARRQKRKRRSSDKKDLKKKPEVFNPVLNQRVSLDKKGDRDIQELHIKGSPEHLRIPYETDYFIEAMSDVQPLPSNKDRFCPAPNLEVRPAHPAPDDELEAMAHLSDLISGATEMDITFSDEYIEGRVHGFGRRLMEKLKKGQFPIQDHIDLHGLTKQEAETRVRDFLIESHRFGLRCVLVVHGRGLNSENNIPVLKERLPIWLSKGTVRKIVLAFSTAQRYDGGTGAIYILLRKQRTGT
jgi:DNA-nicking Smr family endonuclease